MDYYARNAIEEVLNMYKQRLSAEGRKALQDFLDAMYEEQHTPLFKGQKTHKYIREHRLLKE